MASYSQPTEDLPIFDPSVFTVSDLPLTQAQADTRYLRFPLAQGDETIPNLTVGGVSTLGAATFTDSNPAYEINYPVNSGRIDFFSNTAGGVNTRGCKIDSTGVHTVSKFDTIDETAGILNIGTLTGRTGAINIGTGASMAGQINIGSATSTKNITIGGSASGQLFLRGANVFLNSLVSSTNALNPTSATGSMGLGTTMTDTGTLAIGGLVGGSATYNFATGASQSGGINIGTGAGTSLITIGRGSPISIQNGTTTTLTAAVPIQVSYSGTAPTTTGTTAIGFTNSSSNNTFTQSVAGVYDILSFNLTSGVWLVEGCFVFSGATGGGRKLSITTTSGSSPNDRANGVATGSFASLQVSTVFAFSTTTTVYLTIDITAALGGSGTNFTTARWTRIA